MNYERAQGVLVAPAVRGMPLMRGFEAIAAAMKPKKSAVKKSPATKKFVVQNTVATKISKKAPLKRKT